MTYRFLEPFQLNLDTLCLDEYSTLNPRFPGARVEVDPFILLNGNLSYDFYIQPWTLGGQIYLAGENLTNTDCDYKKKYPMPVNNLHAGVGTTILEIMGR